MSLPPRELLESTHTFPCRFVFKSIGPNSQEFVDATRQCAERTVGPEAAIEVSYRVSAAGNHGSVTLHVQVEDADQVLLIYRELAGVAGVRMLL